MAHFYEGDSGVLPITLTVYDPKSGARSTQTHSVTVVSQDAWWGAGDATVCVNPAGDADFAGCPSSEHRNIGTDYGDWDNAVRSNLTSDPPGRRILFKCGATYSADSSVLITQTTATGVAMLVGGYGPAGVGKASCAGDSAATTALVQDTTGTLLLSFPGQSIFDFTFRDLTIDGPGVSGGAEAAISFSGPTKNFITTYHVRLKDHKHLAYWEPDVSQLGQFDHHWSIEDEYVDNVTESNGCYSEIRATNPGAYVQGDCASALVMNGYNSGVIGSLFSKNIGSHSLHAAKGNQLMATNNTFYGSHTSSGKTLVMWNAGESLAPCWYGGSDIGCKTYDIYIGWNVLDDRIGGLGTDGITTHIGVMPEGGPIPIGNEEVVRPVLEGNLVNMNQNSSDRPVCMNVTAHDALVANNVCDAGTQPSASCIDLCGSVVHDSGSPDPISPVCNSLATLIPEVGQRNTVVGNTCYGAAASYTTPPVINLADVHVDNVVQNNFLYCPGCGAGSAVADRGGSGSTVDHNPRQTTGPVPFVGNGSYATIEDYQLASGAVTALDAGAAVPAGASDAAGLCRPDPGGAFDVGAFERNGVSCSVLEADTDADGVADSIDNCPTVPNGPAQAGVAGVGNQTDTDGDGVGDACDNCVYVSNPKVDMSLLTTGPASNSNLVWATVTGEQRDDDHDGFGNKCDADFTPTGLNVGTGDLQQYNASSGKSRLGDTCGTTGTRPCAIFDLDEGTGLNIGTPDKARLNALTGFPAGGHTPANSGKCPSCPLPCASGTAGTCGPIP
jgi:hypothetical protein